MFKSAIESELANTQNPQQRTQLQQALTDVNNYLADNQTAYNTWKEGGLGRSLLHAGAGGLLTGNIGGAAAAGSTSLAAPYLNRAGESLGGAGKAVIDTVGGAAIGWLAGGNAASAIAGANTDRFNRQLHDSEIAKIKRLATGFAKQQNISRDEAEKRLMVQAMRQVDKAYAERYAGYDQRAEAYLKANTATFKAEGQTFTEFANMGYFNDSGKFADQKGYAAERKALNSRQEQPQADRSSRIYSDTAKTAGAGAAKGVGNWIIDNLRAPAPHYVVGGTALVQDKGEAFAYSNAVEKEIGEWGGDKLGRAAMMLGNVQASKFSSPKRFGSWNIDELRNSAKEIDRGELTVAGRALQKHGNREGSSFPRAQGNPMSVNSQAEKIVNDILNNPNTTSIQRNTGRFGKVTDIVAPDGRGLRYDSNGKLIGFLEPKK